MSGIYNDGRNLDYYELMRNRGATGGNGFSRLGAALMGGGQGGAMGAMQAVHAGATARAAMELARERQTANALKEMELEANKGLEGTFRGGDPNSIAAALFQAKHNPNQFAEFMLNNVKAGAGQKASDIAGAPNGDVNTMNRLLAVMHGQPMTLSHEAGGVVFNPSATPDSSQITTTGPGAAQIQQRDAAAAAALALAGKRGANVIGSIMGGGAPSATSTSQVGGLPGNVATNLQDMPGDSAQRITALLKAGDTDPAHLAAAVQQAQSPGQWAVQVGAPGAPQAKSGKPLAAEQIKAFFGNKDGHIDNSLYQDYISTLPKLGMPDSTDALQAYHSGFANVREGGSNVSNGTPSAPPQPQPNILQQAMTAITGGGAQGAIDPSQQSTASDAARPGTEQEYNALPKGALYVHPGDGSLRRKQ